MKIDSFSGEYRWLSNFWPCVVEFEGLLYPSSEHAYQAAKSLGQEERVYIRDQPTPGKAKRAGGVLRLRDDWETVKLSVMASILYDKFTRHPDLAIKLLETEDAELIEGNTWGDRFWGVDGHGENHLGRILMALRNTLRGT